MHLTPERRRQFAELAHIQTKRNAPPCPFLSGGAVTVPCPKKGGICSLRLYRPVGDSSAVPVEGEAGSLRVVCPHRFKQDGVIYSKIGETILGTPSPIRVNEVRFLKRTNELTAETEGEEESEPESEDVGNIDTVLVNPDITLLRWCALEIQAVYFSGRQMGLLFTHIKEYAGEGIPFPDLGPLISTFPN
ncbi:MAG TPA: NotI family restriction endonuclease [Candidatus Acidoferrales bacterium]|nr:NotI family restriction endonuclease [Candidatus Acidoferrales bacterium]